MAQPNIARIEPTKMLGSISIQPENARKAMKPEVETTKQWKQSANNDKNQQKKTNFDKVRLFS